MKAKYRATQNLEFELEAGGKKEMFKELAVVQEIFAEDTCGVCKKDNVKFVVRNVEDNDYYEMRCLSCGAALSFGQHKKGGTLFPKRKGDDGNWLENGGWYKWQKNKNSKN